MSLRSSTSGFLRGLLQRTGRDIVPYNYQHIPALYRPHLLNKYGITAFLDVGGNRGQTGVELREEGYQGRIFSFEPLSQPFATLNEAAKKDGNWTARQCAVGDQDGSLTIHVSGTDWSSSALDMADRHKSMVPESAYVRDETVPVFMLDTLFPTVTNANDKVFLKIDTQGFELHVLRGALKSLPKVQFVQLELSTTPLYVGAPRAHELIAYMDENGFDLVNYIPLFLEKATDRYLQADAIFSRKV